MLEILHIIKSYEAVSQQGGGPDKDILIYFPKSSQSQLECCAN